MPSRSVFELPDGNAAFGERHLPEIVTVGKIQLDTMNGYKKKIDSYNQP
jgi:hypothetical protein